MFTPYLDFIKLNWNEISNLITIISFLFGLISFLQNQATNKKLEIAYFQMREIFLHSSRQNEYIAREKAITPTEAKYLLAGLEGMAAAGMHGIRPYSVDPSEFIFPRKIYHLLKNTKKGLRELLKK